MRPVLLLFFFLSSQFLHAQTVVQRLFNAASAGGYSSNVQNIGQAGHQAFIQYSNAPAHTCTAPVTTSTTAGLYFSFDGTNYSQFDQHADADAHEHPDRDPNQH